jgi:hypothetical protein
MREARWPVLSIALALLFCAPGPAEAKDPAERHSVEKVFPLTPHKEVPVGVRFGEATIESFQIRKWPTQDELEKAGRDPDDTHSMDVELRYTNLNHSRDYKCRTTIVVLGPKDGTVFAEEDTTKTFNKGKSDSYKLSVRMKTRHYKTAKTLKILFEIWKD